MRTRPIQSSSDPVPSGASTDLKSRSEARMHHTTVLLHEAIDFLEIKDTDVVVDGTLGGAGHSKAITALLSEKGVFVGFDLDHDAIERAQVALNDSACKVELIEANFRTLGTALPARGINYVDKALFDLGWSSFQLAGGRGFSFNTDEPLSMSYMKDVGEKGLTAATIVNTWSEVSIADVIFGWGEERFARKIARAICERRQTRIFETARDLAETIKSAVPRRPGKIHPATKTFQALRIAVNDELGSLTTGLDSAWKMLSPGGRIAVIAFHSLEDRIVKQKFVEIEKSGEGKRVTKKPLSPSLKEIQENPRSRSAKLRVIEKNHE